MSEAAPRPRWVRFLPIAGALLALVVVGHFYGAQSTELLVRLPPGREGVKALDLRVTRDDGREVLRARREKASAQGRTVVFDTRLPRGHFQAEAWPEPPDGTSFAATFTFDGEETLELDLAPR